MKENNSKLGMTFSVISGMSLFYGGFLFWLGLSGNIGESFGDALFLYYILQVTIGCVALGLCVFQGFLEGEELYRIFKIAYFNIIVYCVLSILFGTFYTYVVDMVGFLADMLNSVFLVCVIFWLKQYLS